MKKQYLLIILGIVLVVAQVALVIFNIVTNNSIIDIINSIYAILHIIIFFLIGIIGITLIIIGLYFKQKQSDGFSFEINIKNKITDYEFENIIDPIISNLRDKPYEHLVITFSKPEERQNITFIQTAKYGNIYLVEIGKTINNSNYLYRLDKQKLDKVLKIFYIVCVLEIFPDLNKWADMTEEILK